MTIDEKTQVTFNQHQVIIEGASIHVTESGLPSGNSILFLHGYPENWTAFERVMVLLRDRFHVVAIDLPGIGKSERIAYNDKRTIARYVKGIIDALKLEDVTLVGHDVGGMIVYAYLHLYPDELPKAVIMNVAVASVDPWAEVKRNPYIWHFALHAVPELPEILVTGKQKIYFDYFFNTISARPEAITEQARLRYADAYSKPTALQTSFDWYRSFPQDEKDNAKTKGNIIRTSVLYLRGEREYGTINTYLAGFRDAGLMNIQGKIIPNSGHYAPEEQPGEVAKAIGEFVKKSG